MHYPLSQGTIWDARLKITSVRSSQLSIMHKSTPTPACYPVAVWAGGESDTNTTPRAGRVKGIIAAIRGKSWSDASHVDSSPPLPPCQSPPLPTSQAGSLFREGSHHAILSSRSWRWTELPGSWGKKRHRRQLIPTFHRFLSLDLDFKHHSARASWSEPQCITIPALPRDKIALSSRMRAVSQPGLQHPAAL